MERKFNYFKSILLVVVIAVGGLISTNSLAQNAEIEEPLEWTMEVQQDGKEATLIVKGKIEKGWHVYAQTLPAGDGPVATEFRFTPSDDYELIGESKPWEYDSNMVVIKVDGGKYITHHDPNFDMNLNYFEDEVTFKQKIKVNTDAQFTVSGFMYYMVCNDVKCLPPEDVPLAFAINGGVAVSDADGAEFDDSIIPHLEKLDLDNPIIPGDGSDIEKQSAWMVFLLGLFGGLFALITPCVFPMIPLTVSFFTKGSENKGKGRFKAIMYGFFIFAIYVSLSIPFHLGSDPELLNEISTNIWTNLIFFVVFVVFAISFFGYFEITLPSSWTTKADSAANNIGGLIGVFLMAFTLALVSFSCTGPILGSVLATSASDGAWPVTAAMAGFGIALGLPFALFALFPGWMNSLPKSGGWLNSVKVVLGFVELALALKFLSNADLVEQWGLVHRETFFLIWIILGVGLSLYLFGKIKFPHDSPIKKLSKFRIGFGILVVAFTLYLTPGLTNTKYANVSLVSGFPPPLFYSWYEKGTKCPLGIDCSKDWDKGLAKAKKKERPILLDFTGWACVNCRKMEENVWPNKEIFELINDEYQLISLYVDDKRELPKSQQGYAQVPKSGGGTRKKFIRTIGNKWATFESVSFRNNAQPLYILLSPDGQLLTKPVGYTPDVDEYKAFLERGLKAWEMIQNGEVNTKKKVETKEGKATEHSNESANINEPVVWSTEINKISDTEYELVAKATIEAGWHVYAQELPSNDGPVATEFRFKESDQVELIGETKPWEYDSTMQVINVEGGKYITHYDPNFEMDLNYFENNATFKQRIKLKEGVNAADVTFSGFVYFMVCNDEMCLPPEDIPLEYKLQ
jgi:thiol:disulfide interchange protein